MPRSRPSPLTLSHFFTAVVLAMISASAAPGEKVGEHPTCRPSPEMAEMLDGLEYGPECGGGDPCWRERIERTEAMLAERPDDLLLHRAYQDLVRNLRGDDKAEAVETLRDAYAVRAAERPEDPASLYLAARVEADEAKGLELIERGLALDSGYPWLHMGAAALLTSVEPERKDEVLGHVETFEQLCPNNLNSLFHARRVDAPDFWRPRLERYRDLLAADTAGHELGAYRHLWAADFALTPLPEHDATRRRLRGDLEHLARRDRADDEMWWSVRRQGAQMLGDPEALAALEQEMGEKLPCNDTAVKRRMAPWERDPGTDPAAPETLRAALAASDEWITLCPEEFRTHFFRFLTVSDLAGKSELDDDLLLREAERMLGVWEKSSHKIRMTPSIYGKVAGFFLDHGLELERIEPLIDQEDAFAETNKVSLDRVPESARSRFASSEKHGKIQRQALRLRLALAREQPENARQWLAEIETSVAEYAELADEPDWVERQKANLPWLKGLIAEHEERWLDALLLYRQALGGKAMGVAGTTLEASIERLWRQLGGSEEGWAVLEAEDDGAVATETSLWRPLGEALPELELTDLTGEIWRRDDFLGSATLVNFWSTSCAPCRVELPHLQQLAQELEGKGVRVVTLNIDHEVGLVAPFVESEKLDLPVVLGRELFEARGLSAVPTSWIIDPEGTIRHQQVGFSSLELEKWVEQTRDLLLEAAGRDG